MAVPFRVIVSSSPKMAVRFVGMVAFCSLLGARSVAAMPAGPLRIDVGNRRDLSDGTKAVYLTGSHTWANNRDNSVSDPPQPFNYTAYLDFMTAHNHNFFRRGRGSNRTARATTPTA